MVLRVHGQANNVLQREGDEREVSIETFEALLELLNVHPQLPGGAPLKVTGTLRGWRMFTRMGVVTALRLMVGISGRELTQFALHLG